MTEYNFKDIENKWQEQWQKKGLLKFDNSKSAEKKYLLEMFPYPSGKIHMGHVRNYTIGDVYCRYLIMKGYNVLHPMGWDAFGLPAENAAIKNKISPAKWTKENINSMRSQLQTLGFIYQWENTEIATCNEDYYKWGQWFFLKMYEKGLVYKKSSKVNWCPDCNTVLANEQAQNGVCWRCDSQVEQKNIEQWFFKITDYAEELLNDLDKLTGWPEQVKTMQRNWIGKSYGTEINFKIEGTDEIIPVFTTRADTIFGCTYMVLAVEHPLVQKFMSEMKEPEKLKNYIAEIKSKDSEERTSEKSEKTGMFLEKYAINPVNGEKVEIWVADYVLMDYGTGAIMAVPTHDERDFKFSKKYNLPMKIVIQNNDNSLEIDKMESAYIENGTLVNSKQFDGLNNRDAIDKISIWMEENSMGKRTINYRLRDWGLSRQRYWGNPIPMMYCEKCGNVPESYENLPVLLPENVTFSGTGNPLDSCEEFINVKCPKCGGSAKRETDTMDTFVDSSWYFFRYTDSQNDKEPFNTEIVNKWMPVDQYIGGIEHACMHLIYARFFTKVIRDLGLSNIDEPFKNLLTQGMVIKDGAKMSKSLGNVVEPSEIISKYGADTARLFCLFAAPPEKDLDWNDKGIEGSYRFLNRIWNLLNEKNDSITSVSDEKFVINKLNADEKKLLFALHKTIKKVTIDVSERFHFNTAIASLMELLNLFGSVRNNINNKLLSVFMKNLVKMLTIFAPHISEEMWQKMGYTTLLSKETWPIYIEDYTKDEEITVVVQINGKVRKKLNVSADITKEEIESIVKSDEIIIKWIADKQIKKFIYVPKKLVSIVI